MIRGRWKKNLGSKTATILVTRIVGQKTRIDNPNNPSSCISLVMYAGILMVCWHSLLHQSNYGDHYFIQEMLFVGFCLVLTSPLNCHVPPSSHQYFSNHLVLSCHLEISWLPRIPCRLLASYYEAMASRDTAVRCYRIAVMQHRKATMLWTYKILALHS